MRYSALTAIVIAALSASLAHAETVWHLEISIPNSYRCPSNGTIFSPVVTAARFADATAIIKYMELSYTDDIGTRSRNYDSFALVDTDGDLPLDSSKVTAYVGAAQIGRYTGGYPSVMTFYVDYDWDTGVTNFSTPGNQSVTYQVRQPLVFTGSGLFYARYCLQSYDGDSGPLASDVKFKVNVACDTMPGAVMNAVSYEEGAVHLSWSPSPATEAVSQKVYRATTPTGPWTLVGSIADNTTKVFVDLELTPSNTHYYKVVAEASGEMSGADSNVISITIPGTVVVTPDSSPDNVVVDLNLSGSGLPTWSGTPFNRSIVTFDGIDDSYRVASSDLLNSANFTIEAWVKNGFQCLKRNGSPYVWEQFFLSVSNGGKAVFWIASNGVRYPLTSSTSIGNDWTHLAATYDGSTQRIYINGVLDAENTVNLQVQPWTEYMVLYAEPFWDNTHCQGSMSEFRFWKVARTQAQIAAAMNSELSVGDPDLVVRYDLSNGGPNLIDTTGNGHTGTAQSSPAFSDTLFSPVNVRIKNGTKSRYASGILTSTPTSIDCSIDLTGMPAGKYDVEVLENGTVNAVLSKGFTVTSDLLKIVDIWPAPGSALAIPPSSIVATFSKDLDSSSVSASSVQLVRAGVDGMFDTSDDVLVTPASLAVNGGVVTLDMVGVKMPDDNYRLKAVSGTGAQPSSGLAAFWNLDEATGSVAADSSANNYDGSLVNNPAWATGKINSALQFNGSTNYVNVPNSPDLGGGSFTLAAWIWRDAGVERKFMDKWNDNSGEFQFSFQVYQDSKLWLSIRQSNGVEVIPRGNTTINTGQWYHVAAVANAATQVVTLYVNGVAETLQSNPNWDGTVRSVPMELNIGRKCSNHDYWQGRIDDVRIYNRALSTSEIESLSLAQVGITDLNGNILDGEPNAELPSGDGIAGGDFTATFTLATPPLQVTALTPVPNNVLGASPASVVVTFSKNVDPATVNNSTCRLINLGADNTLGGGDDTEIAPSAVSVNGNVVTLNLDGLTIPAGNYKLRLTSGAPQPSSTGLVAYWKCDEGQNNVILDASGFGYSGTLDGSTSWTSGIEGSALSFDNTNGYVMVSNPTPGAFGAGDFTVSCWIKTTDSAFHIIGNRHSTDHAPFWTLMINSAGKATLEVDQDTAGTNYNITSNATVAINNGAWHHIAAIRTGATLKIYVDGILDVTSTGPGTANVSSGGEVLIADNPFVGLSSALKFAGALDEIRIYKRAITLTEIQLLSALAPASITDFNGNSLDGEFAGAFPSGNGSAGGDFIAGFRIDAPPVASDQTLSTHAGVALPVVLGANDPDNDSLSYTVGTPLLGSLSGTAPNLVYTPPPGTTGSDSFSFTVNDGVLSSNVATITIFLTNLPPSVLVAASPQAVPPNEFVTFTSSGSDPDGDGLTYAWNFGDNTFASDQNTAHSYSQTGTYTATVTVTDPSGATASASVIIVVDRAPTVRITTDEVVGFGGLPMLFDASYSTDPENQIVSYSWNFGDGTPLGSGQIISKIYEQPGTYLVTLTVTDAAGVTSTLTRLIEVLPADQIGLFNAFVNYKVRWDRDKNSKDTLQINALFNVGEDVTAAGTVVALDIAGQHFEGVLDRKLRDRSNPNDIWQVKASLRNQPFGTVHLKVKIKNANLGEGFNLAGALAGGDPHDFVDATIPVRITVGGRSFEVNVASEFKFNANGKRAKGEGDE